jgi:hypothetical protein
MWFLYFSNFCLHLSELLGAIFIRRIFRSHIESSHILSFPEISRVVVMLRVTGYRNLFILNDSLFYCSYDGKVVQKKVIKLLFKTS